MLRTIGSRVKRRLFRNRLAVDLEASSSQYFQRQWGAGAGTSRRKATWSFFSKRESVGADAYIVAQNSGDNQNPFQFGFNLSNQFVFNGQIAGVPFANLISTPTFADVASFHHIVFAMDTDQATSTDRVKVYIDDIQITAWGTATFPSLSQDTPYNGHDVLVKTGTQMGVANSWDGIVDEFIHVDGQQLTPAVFAKANRPKAYLGTYGIKGFALRFEDGNSLGTDTSGNGNTWTPVNTPVATSTTA